MSIVQPQKNIPGTENNNETPVQPAQAPTIPGSPPGTTYGHENDRDPSGATVDPANREPAEPARVVPEPSPVITPAKGK